MSALAYPRCSPYENRERKMIARQRTTSAVAGADPYQPENQAIIAALAFEFWLAREFRDGSPEEDLYRALCAFRRIPTNPAKLR